MLLQPFESFAAGYRVTVDEKWDTPAGLGWHGRIWRGGAPIGRARDLRGDRGVQLDIADPKEQARFDDLCEARYPNAFRPDAALVESLKNCDLILDTMKAVTEQSIVIAAPADAYTEGAMPAFQRVAVPDTPANRQAVLRDNPGWRVLNDELRAWSPTGGPAPAQAATSQPLPAGSSASAAQGASSPPAAPSAASAARRAAGPSL